MARSKSGSPTLELHIDAEQRQKAIESSSGGCLIADGIKDQYPQYSGVTVDMATIRVTDREAGFRYTYLTPPAAQHLLLSFDQGWPQPVQDIVLRRAVKITPIHTAKSAQVTRQMRLQELEEKIAAGEELSPYERRSLGQLRRPPRPTGPGKTEIKSHGGYTVVKGGKPLPQGKDHPNLLRGRNRHFGAKLADPGVAFNEAVEAAVAERLAQEAQTQIAD
jgi:hypothetical protein